ncbi:hypothetical protein HK097_000768, partial [Rhizophlyctis rosea]
MGKEDDAEQEISLTIEETNRLRISMGLKPLVVDGPATSSEQTAEDNYAKYKEDLEAKREGQAVLERIERAKNKAATARKLTGATLGDASDDEDASGDALAWVEKQKQKDEEKKRKRQKAKEAALAKQKARELEELDESVVEGGGVGSGSGGKGKGGRKGGKEAGSAGGDGLDLGGLKVDHSIEDVAESGEVILTLKDAGVLDDDNGDILQNVSLAEAEKTRENLENKRKKVAYDVYNDSEFHTGNKSSILSQYDEPSKKSSFALSSTGTIEISEEERKKKMSEGLREGAQKLEYEKMGEVRDYYTQEEMVAFRKPKKKKRVRKERTRLEDLDAVEEGGGRDHG